MVTPQVANFSGGEDFKSGEEHIAKVNIWDPDAREGRCGHASVSLKKVNGSEKVKEYVGMWPNPKFGVLVNPFTLMLAVPGMCHKSKKECMDREGDEAPLKPSRSYQIKLTPEQYKKMQEEIKLQNEKIENGSTLYTLFSNFNVVSLAKRISNPRILEHLHACPISEQTMDHDEVIQDSQHIKNIDTHHCTTMAANVLQKGGYDIRVGYTPWGLSPGGLAGQLDRMRHSDASIMRKV